MKEQILILSIVLLPFGVMAEWSDCGIDEETNCEWQISDGVLTVRPKAGATDVAIPDYTRDCTMTKSVECTTPAPWRWDEDASTVTTLKIESGITSIGEVAFEDMGFTKAILPDGIETINDGAFMECRSLNNINLPDGLTSIIGSAFSAVPLENVIIPDSVVEIGRHAFNRNDKLQSLVIGENAVVSEKAIITDWDLDHLELDFDKFKMYCAAGNTSCEAAFQKAFDIAKNIEKIDSSAQISDFLKTYTKDGNGFYQIDDKLYATADLMTHNAACDDAANCQAILDAASQGKPFEVGGKYYATLDLFANGAACTDKKNCEDILSSNGNPFKVGSKIYNSMADFANGNYVKHRIYTIEEANFVAGPVNRVSIKYR